MTFIQRKLDTLRRRAQAHDLRFEKPILSPAKRFWSRWGFSKPPKLSDFGLFAGGAIFLLATFGLVAGLSTGINSAKKILGDTAIGFEFLRSQDLEAARLQFAKIEGEIEASNLGMLAGYIPEISGHLLAAVEIIQNQTKEFSAIDLEWDEPSNSSSDKLYYRLADSQFQLERAGSELDEAILLVNQLPTNLLSGDTRADVETGLALLGSARESLRSATKALEIILSLLAGQEKTYLLIFQNNNEARATGGFIGTYGLVSFGNGQMKINKIESIYEPDGQLREAIAAPGPLRSQVTQLWGMRDSNWFADFPKSSRKLLEFLEQETGVLADGVISFTPDLFEDVLTLTGPIPMPDYDTILTAENFRTVVQNKTSIEYNRALNQPKKFLADFAPRLLASFSSLGEEQRYGILGVISKAVVEKQLLMFSLDPALEGLIADQSLAGEIKHTAGDYLAVIHSNVGGGKTDQGMMQEIEKRVSIDGLGKHLTTVRITRTNRATNELYFPVNVDFMRIFVPAGSRLLQATGFDDQELLASVVSGATTDPDLAFWDAAILRDWQSKVYIGSESGYTIFMGWLAVEPGQTRTVELTYELPQTGSEYSLLLQKQAGAREFSFDLQLEASGRNVIYQYPERFGPQIIDSDRFYAAVAR